MAGLIKYLQEHDAQVVSYTFDSITVVTHPMGLGEKVEVIPADIEHVQSFINE